MKTNVTFEYLLPGSAKEISIYFSDFHLFGKHHPYMIEVIETEKNTYFVRESLKLWNIVPMKPCYEVQVWIIEPEKRIQYTSEVSKGVFLEINYTFIENVHTKTVKVIEAMLIKGYPIINPVFVGILKRSRIILIESIRKELIEKVFSLRFNH